MSVSFTPQLKELLIAADCYFERQGKGDHEIWYSPITERRFVVDGSIKSRHREDAWQCAARQVLRDDRFYSFVQSSTAIAWRWGQ